MAKVNPYIIVLIIVAWILIPTGTPDDIISIALMARLGSAYPIVVGIILLTLYYQGVTISKAKKEMKSFLGGLR